MREQVHDWNFPVLGSGCITSNQNKHLFSYFIIWGRSCICSLCWHIYSIWCDSDHSFVTRCLKRLTTLCFGLVWVDKCDIDGDSCSQRRTAMTATPACCSSTSWRRELCADMNSSWHPPEITLMRSCRYEENQIKCSHSACLTLWWGFWVLWTPNTSKSIIYNRILFYITSTWLSKQ